MEQDCVGGFHIPSYKTSERYGTAPRLESKYGLSSFTPAGVTVETMYDGINPDEYDQEFNHRISTTEIAYWKIKTWKSGWKSDEILSKKQSDLLTWLLDSLAEVGPYYGKIEAVSRKLTMFRRKNEEVRRVSLMIIKKIPDLLSNYKRKLTLTMLALCAGTISVENRLFPIVVSYTSVTIVSNQWEKLLLRDLSVHFVTLSLFYNPNVSL